jgi:hypothetical protein
MQQTRIAFVEQFLERLGNRTGTVFMTSAQIADWFVKAAG